MKATAVEPLRDRPKEEAAGAGEEGAARPGGELAAKAAAGEALEMGPDAGDAVKKEGEAGEEEREELGHSGMTSV